MTFLNLQHWIVQHINVWQLFGYLSLILSTGFLLLAGYQRAWNKRSWTLLVSAFVFGSGLGSMFLPSIMGALLGGSIIFLLVKRLIGFSDSSADLFVIYMITVVGIGRLGCLFSGCCFGSVTDLPWGIQYSMGNLAHWLHFHSGQQPYLHDPSLRVHPVQLYEALVLLGLMLPAALLASRRKGSGTTILSTFGASYFLLRFFLEFVRGMSNVWWSEIYLGPVSLFQVFLLSIACTFVLFSIYVWRRPADPAYEKDLSPLLDERWIFSGIIFSTLLLSDHFQRVQIILLLSLLPINLWLFYLTWEANHESKPHFNPRWVMGISGFMILLSTQAFLGDPGQSQTPVFEKSRWLYDISQAGQNAKLVRLGDRRLSFSDYARRKQIFYNLPDSTEYDSTLHQKAMLDLKDPIVTYSLGGSYTSYEFDLPTCGGDPVTEKVVSSSFMASIDRERSRSERVSSYINGRMEFSQGSITPSTTNEKNYLRYGTLFLNGGLDGEVIGAGLGFGLLAARGLDKEYIPFMPAAYLRLGPREIHIEAGLNDRYYHRPGIANIHMSLGHKPITGTGWQVGIGNRGPLLISSMVYFATATRLRIGSLFLADVTVSIIGGEHANGFGTTVMLRLPGR